jgi:hypothetical protein
MPSIELLESRAWSGDSGDCWMPRDGVTEVEDKVVEEYSSSVSV